MPSVKQQFADLKVEEIIEFGRLGVSPEMVFKSLSMNEKSKKVAMSTDKWRENYNKGLAQREIEIAQALDKTKDPQLLKMIVASTTLTDKKAISESAEFIIDAPEWIRPKVKRAAGKRKVEDAPND